MKDVSGCITGIAGKDGLGKGGVGSGVGGGFVRGGGVGGGSGSREVVVDKGSEHLLVAEEGLEFLVGSRTRVVGTAEKFQAVGSGSGGKIRVLKK